MIKTPAPFSQTIFEASPLNKVIEQGAPGSVWQPAAGQRDNSSGRTILISEAVNNSSVNYATDGYAVRLWKASANTNASYKRDLSTSGYYSTGELFVKISKDENWLATDGKAGTVEEYTDKEGHVVLKRLFNLKDGNVQVLSTYYVYDDLGNLSFVLTPGAGPDGGSIDQTALDVWCYQYRYDGRRRLVEKKIPGKGWEYMVYNQLDQLVLSQDAVQHAAGQWMFSKYDALGRIVVTGVYNDASGRISLAATVAADTVLYESRPSGSANYSNLAFPQSIAHYHNIQYYDDYSFAGASSYVYSGSSRTRGLQTGSRTGVLGTDDLLLSVNYYDEEGRVAKVFKQHYQSGAVNVGNYDEITNSYNFEGALTASNRVHHNASSGSTTIATHYDYDHVGRKLRSYEQIAGGADVLLVENRYNEIGQLKEKGLGGGLQNTAYNYNERGWLKGSTSNEFSLQIKYQDGDVPQFNGNISGQLWGNGATTDQSFSYNYDKLNRLLNGTATGMSEILSYDVMGNISSLNRDGLVRSYVYSGNQLLKTTGVATVADYAYDLNGNATVDGRTGKSFTYNVLNLPETVSGGLSYVYDAAGSKLKKTNGGNVTDYIDGIQYTNGAIELIQTEAGIARRNGSGYSYEYNLGDHLGNNRLTFYKNPNGSLEVLQRDDYYAFGLRKSVQGSSTENKYLYNGKELQDELGQYDYGARFYDPVIGRWNVVDPLAELDRKLSPYAYAFNNPMTFIDPTGMKGESTHTDWLGNVIAVYDDGDLGVYTHSGESKADIDKAHSSENTSAGGTKIGETWTPLSFADFDVFQATGEVVVAKDARIDFNSNWATDQVNGILSENPSAYAYSKRAGQGGDWDIKRTSEKDGNGLYYGSKLFGKYASARDAGNIAAGMVAQRSNFPNLIIDYGFGAYNQAGNSKVKAGMLGLLDGYIGTIYPPAGFGLLIYRAMFGEDKLSKKGIDLGKSLRKSR